MLADKIMDPEDTDEDQECLNLELFVAINYGLKRKNVTEEEIIEKVKESLCNGADINAINHNNAGNTALHVAVRRQFSKVIQYLLDNGVNVHIKNSQGLTALTLAQTLKSQQKIVDLLDSDAKLTSDRLSITYSSENQTVFYILRNNLEMAVLEVNCCELSPDFLYQVQFYDAIDSAGNLFFVDVMLSDGQHVNENFIKNQLNRLNKQLIIQCGSILVTKVFCRYSEGNINVINLNNPVEYFDEKTLTDRLSRPGFGISLIIDALKLNLVGKFETKRISLLNESFNLDKEFGGQKLIDFVIRNGDLMTTRLLLLNPCNLSSKTSMFILAAEHGDVNKLGAVLRVKFPIQLNNSIYLPKETAAHFDKCKKRMLQHAVRAGNCDIIIFLIRCGVELDDDIIDLAWDNKQYDVVLIMLNADCVFPLDFELDKIDVSFTELRHFVEERDHLHSLIENGQSISVKKFVKSIPPSKLYLNKDNRSAVYRALKCSHFNLFVWLKSELKAEFRNADERKSVGVGKLDSASDALLPYFVPIDNAHILQLVAKSRCRQNYAYFKDHIESIYTELNSIPQISTVLKVIQFCDQVDIIYDFDNDSIVDVNVSGSESEKGFCEYKVGRIYIGAKVDRQELLGTIAHELTHLAIQTIYDNDCKPYQLDDPIKDEFDQIIMGIRKQSTPVDSIIRRVFSCYREVYWPSELIVRVNHMLATQGLTDGLQCLEVQARSLLEFYTKNVEKRFKNFVSESHLIKPRYLIKVLNDNAGVIGKIDDSKIKLKNCIDVQKELCEGIFKIAVVTSTNPLLSTMSVYQSLNEINQQPNSFLIFNFDDYVKRRININQAFYSDVCKFLVLLCESVPDGNSLFESLRELAQVIWKKPDKKIIFIMENSELLKEKINQIHNICLVVYNDVEYTLDDLTVDSAKPLLDQIVSLQCRDANIKLSSLIDNEHLKLVDAQTLLKLINKQPIVIGKEMITSAHYNEHFYIDRLFSIQSVIKEDILRDKDELTMYATTELDEITLSKAAEQFEQLCQQFPRHNIHWLNKVNGVHHWLESRCVKGDLTRLQELVDTQFTSHFTEDHIADKINERRVILVSDTAGMGKSTVLTSLAQRLTKKYSHLWMIRVDLNDYTKILDEEQENQSFKKDQLNRALVFFVGRLLGSRVESRLETEFEKNLLLHLMQNDDDRVVIMFDGFDEIKWSHQNVIKDLLVALKSSKVKQLWVTTRPHMRESLENTVHHLTYTLKPLNKTDQVNFLTRFWRYTSNLGVESVPDNLQCFAEALIDLLSKSISDKDRVFTGIPLQLRMVGECFEVAAKEFYFSNKTKPNLPSKLQLNDLYRMFFNRKYAIFQSEKNKSDSSKPNVEAQNDVMKEFFLDNHRIASLFTNFDKNEYEQLMTKDELNSGFSFINDIASNKWNTGLIDLIIDGKPRFVHLTFAEFLTAEFIVNLISRDQQDIERIGLIVTDVLYLTNFEVVRAFIDSQFSQKTISDAVLNEHGKSMSSVWLERFRDKKTNLSFPDGRISLLHVQAFEGHANIAKYLLNCLGDCDIRDKLIKCVNHFQWQALHLAADNDHLDVVKILIDHKADLNVRVANENEFHGGYNAMLIAATEGQANVCEWLINNGADISATVTGDSQCAGYNVLQLAAFGGNLDVVKMLSRSEKIDFKFEVKANGPFDSMNALHIATFNKHWDVVKWIISEGLIDINDTIQSGTYCGETILFRSVKKGPPEVIQWLIDHNADVNIGNDCDKNTTMHIATVKNKLNVVKMLVSNGANVNAVNSDGQTPLHSAAHLGHQELVEFLLTIKDINVNMIDNNGKTAVEAATMNGRQNIADILTREKAEPGIEDKIDELQCIETKKSFHVK